MASCLERISIRCSHEIRALPAKWIGIMPGLHAKAYHSAFSAPEVKRHFICGACAFCLLTLARPVKQIDIDFRKKLRIYSLLTIEAPNTE
jgi:hypothetical protein